VFAGCRFRFAALPSRISVTQCRRLLVPLRRALVYGRSEPDYYRCALITNIINPLERVELIEAGLDREVGAADLVVTV
jgi:hypothetical protein